MAGAVARMADGEHDWHLHQHAHHGGEGGTGSGPEQRDGSSNRQLEEIAGTNERAGSGDGMLHAEQAHQPVGQTGIEIYLQENRDSDQEYVEIAPRDVLRLERENANQGGEQGHDGNGGEAGQQSALKPLAPMAANEPVAERRPGCQGYDY